jgi:PilZ domain
MTRDAWVILEDGTQSKCVWSDISDRGACINIQDAEDIPDNFFLLLAKNGSPRRRCRVIWRKPRQLGVKFETQLDERLREVLGKKPGGGAKVAPKEAEPAESDA